MVLIWNGISNQESQPFEIWTNGSHFVKHHLNEIWTKTTNFEWSSFQMVGTIAIAKAHHSKTQSFEIRPSKSLDFKCFQILNGWTSYPNCKFRQSRVPLQDWTSKQSTNLWYLRQIVGEARNGWFRGWSIWPRSEYWIPFGQISNTIWPFPSYYSNFYSCYLTT